MTFIRHRDRMVQESVFEDLDNTLIACRWKAGTTTRAVLDPFTPGAPAAVITTSSNQVLKLVQGYPVQLVDFFRESGGATTEEEAAVNKPNTPPNTLAIDDGQPGDSALLEMGSRITEQPYVFTMAFYGNSDSVAKALMNDLRDRYLGRIVTIDAIDLYDYNTDPDAVVCRMEVDAFRSSRNLEAVSAPEVHLFFAELQITDFVEE